ncbi:MAG TPA: basic secretory protein-like protein [Gemmatimonadaceae bacterium]|nr:basic secretory protein-like protein [Gemmatimonadaceae bacterium]
MRPYYKGPAPALASAVARAIVRVAIAVTLAALVAAPRLDAQSFGRNKVRYDNFDFRALASEHFDVHYYPAESLAASDAARMAERWYARHSAMLLFESGRSPLIFYADHADFQQTNVIGGFIGEGTGGVTEGSRERVIMPFTGAYAETDHVLGHEIVHVYQYRIAKDMPNGLRSIAGIPLWLIEGMAEYMSLGRNDPNTAMWLRDALRRDDLPTLDQLTNDPRYFPYRYGQALWAYIGGRWGDATVNQLFRAALERVLAVVAAPAGFEVAPGRGSRTASPYSRGVFSLNGFAAASRSRSTDVPATGLVVFGCFERACFAGALSFPLRLFMARSFEGGA